MYTHGASMGQLPQLSLWVSKPTQLARLEPCCTTRDMSRSGDRFRSDHSLSLTASCQPI